LLSQVRQSLSLALASASDSRLFFATVLDVRIEPGHGSILVVIGAPSASIEETRASLAIAKGRLRAEVASALQRKRAPDFVFLVLDEEGLREGLHADTEEDAW
jgi:ribosome-binding factor A